MYDKGQIDMLYRKYCETEDPKVFEELIAACRPLVFVILLRYRSFQPWWEDIAQDVLLKIWKNLRNPDQLKRHLVSPSSFLYSRIWPYIYYSLSSVSKQNGVPISLTRTERIIIKLHEEDGLEFDQISRIVGLAPSTCSCLFYIGRQKRDGLIISDSLDSSQVGETVGEFLDPCKQVEVIDTRRGWYEKVEERLSMHPYYSKNRSALGKVKRLLKDVVEEDVPDDEL